MSDVVPETPLRSLPDFRALFESAPKHYVVLAPDMTIVAASAAFVGAMATVQEEILGRAIFEVFPDDPNAGAVQHLRESLHRVLKFRRADAMPVQRYEALRLRENGGGGQERHWIPLNIPVLDEAGDVAWIIHRVEDVTPVAPIAGNDAASHRIAGDHHDVADRLRAANEALARQARELEREVEERTRQELAAREMAARLRAVVDTAVHGVVIIDGSGKITMFNPAAERLFGFSAAELIGRNVSVLMPAPVADQHDRYIQDYHRTGRRKIIGIGREVVAQRKDGSTFPIDLAVGEAKHNGESLFVGVIVDLSERKHAETALRLWSDAFENAAFGIAIADPGTGTIRVVNRAMAQMHGLGVDEMQGTNICDAYAPEERGRVATLLAACDSAGHVAFEALQTRKDGSAFPTQMDITSVRDSDGTVRYRIASAFDISARRQAEDQLRQFLKMEAIGNLTGGMAHDFNNLLGVIIGNLDLARPQLAALGAVDELVGDALDAALRGADLTRRLLAFARQQPLLPEPIKLNELIAGMVKLLDRTLGENIEISLDLGADLWTVVADPTQLETSLMNLATNARDAMPKGGRLMIATGNRQLDADYAAAHAEVVPGDYVAIEVSDTGSGIAPETLKRVFEPFFTTKERGKGTGLGLSMVFGFMKQSGGHINIYSEPGAGTTFRLYLPRAAAGERGAAESAAVPLAKAEGETVLAVEDNPALRRVVARQLKELGYRVIEADGAAAAMAVLESRNVDLLFTDIVMPGELDGFELARRVIARWPRIKVVFTSGFPEAKVDDKFRSLGTAARLLSKPYRKDDLARILRDALDF
jgi:PAS domain S-box-containing protein